MELMKKAQSGGIGGMMAMMQDTELLAKIGSKMGDMSTLMGGGGAGAMQDRQAVAALMALQQFPQMNTATTCTGQRPASPSRALWTESFPNAGQAATQRQSPGVVDNFSITSLEPIYPSRMTRCSCYRDVRAQKTS